MPSQVICRKPILKIGVPGVRNRLKLTLRRSRNMMDFKPRTMNFTGTLESLMAVIRKIVAARYAQRLSAINKVTMYTRVPNNFVLGSNL